MEFSYYIAFHFVCVRFLWILESFLSFKEVPSSLDLKFYNKKQHHGSREQQWQKLLWVKSLELEIETLHMFST